MEQLVPDMPQAHEFTYPTDQPDAYDSQRLDSLFRIASYPKNIPKSHRPAAEVPRQLVIDAMIGSFLDSVDEVEGEFEDLEEYEAFKERHTGLAAFTIAYLMGESDELLKQRRGKIKGRTPITFDTAKIAVREGARRYRHQILSQEGVYMPVGYENVKRKEKELDERSTSLGEVQLPEMNDPADVIKYLLELGVFSSGEAASLLIYLGMVRIDASKMTPEVQANIAKAEMNFSQRALAAADQYPELSGMRIINAFIKRRRDEPNLRLTLNDQAAMAQVGEAIMQMYEISSTVVAVIVQRNKDTKQVSSLTKAVSPVDVDMRSPTRRRAFYEKILNDPSIVLSGEDERHILAYLKSKSLDEAAAKLGLSRDVFRERLYGIGSMASADQ